MLTFQKQGFRKTSNVYKKYDVSLGENSSEVYNTVTDYQIKRRVK